MTENKRHIAILGAGESGVGAAQLAVQKGFDVFLSDAGKVKDTYAKTLNELKVEWESGKHTEERILSCDLIIKSPGIPPSAPLIQKLKEAGKEIISEIEFASRYTDAKMIAITGSNGKTTTTNLIYHILKSAGKDVAMVGNVGQSFAGALAENDHDFFVVEVSSFQLEDVNSFKPLISILLNITPDHLDRYNNNFEEYAKTKFRIAEFQDEADFFIYNGDDETVLNILNQSDMQPEKLAIGLKKKEFNGAYANNEQVFINPSNNPLIMSIHELALQGKHNIYNSMASAVAARILELRKEVIRESLMDFKNIEHRLEFVMKVHGISFINDSKATNINSAWYALESIEGQIVWIVGGVDKGNDYEQVKELVADKVKAIICLGKDNKKIIKAFKDIVPVIQETDSASDAVAASYAEAKTGETVLLSPACASFDLFESYEDRGNQFKRAVKSL